MTSTSESQWVVLFLVPYELTKKNIPLCENIGYFILKMTIFQQIFHVKILFLVTTSYHKIYLDMGKNIFSENVLWDTASVNKILNLSEKVDSGQICMILSETST